MSSALPIHMDDQTPQQGTFTKPPTGFRQQSFSRPPMYPISPPPASTGYAISIQKTSADHDPNFSSTGSYIGPGLGMGNGSPMSLGMSFGANGDLLRSFKGGMSYRQGNGGFGSLRGGMGSFVGSKIPKDDLNDPFLHGDTMSGSPMSFSSMRGLNSYRSPPALGRPVSLSSSHRAFSNWTKEQFGVDKKEAEFMKDFSCCGAIHHSLHELLEHYEEEHVMIIGKGGEADGGFPVVADFDVEMDMFEGEDPSSSSTASTSTSTNSTQTSPSLNNTLLGLLPTYPRTSTANSGMKQLGPGDGLRPILPPPSVGMASIRGEKESAFNTFLVTPLPGSLFNGRDASSGFVSQSGVDGRKATSAYAKRPLPTTSRAKGSAQLSHAFGANVRNSEMRSSPTVMAVPPSLLELRTNKAGQVIVPLVLDHKGNAIRPSPSELQQAALNAPPYVPGEEDEEHDVAGELPDAALAPSPYFKYRPYRCNKPGCTKTYKQANGLKYHLLKGQCNFDPNYANNMDRLALEDVEDKPKAFACVVGNGCKKRYKHMTGLRQHYLSTGDHGAVGLAMLNDGTHPEVDESEPSQPRPTKPVASRAPSNAPGTHPGGWLDGAIRPQGTPPIGMPRGGNDMRDQTGENAVLFSTADEYFQNGVPPRQQ